MEGNAFDPSSLLENYQLSSNMIKPIEGGSLSLQCGLAYACPTIAVSFLIGPIALLQGIYAKYFGLSLGTIAAVILIARLFDAVTDPLVGYFSDRYFHRTGSRKLFITLGGLLLVFSSYFLYVPFGFDTRDAPFQVSGEYFLTWFLAFYLGYTLFETPHLAWGGEIVTSSKEKNKIYSLRALTVSTGLMLFFSVPLLPFFDSSEFTPRTLAWSVLFSIILMLPLLYYCINNVPDGESKNNNNHHLSRSKKFHLRELFRIARGNKSFLIFIAALFFAGAGTGMWFGMMFLFVDVYLRLGHSLSLVYMLSYGASIILITFWYAIANRFGKKTSWSSGMLMVAIGILGTGFLSPGGAGWISLLVCMILINGGIMATVLLAPSLLADIIDYSLWKYDQDYAATYFSIYALTTKANLAIGGAFGLAIAGYYGFEPTASTQSERALDGMRLSVAWLPSFLTMVSIMFIKQIPMNIHRHNIIRRRLDLRAKSRVII